MAKGKFLRTVTRTINGEEFTFHAFTNHAMMHVYGRGDARPESTGRLYLDDPGNVVIGSLINNLRERGTVQPGAWGAA
ncbi:hypothetical protein M2360_003683 [Rhizobium sp. SG_E_25_P2]|uniref:hypothetical protein n=1 Tax=Rhizobium sp. SG_E_25_P2 TaxID=2879942 RepID=UPI002473217B|nr:hypothetical protein [Rhizobium sp. SG_E_25_P2]MDH6268278.1 hypothetical protein [Rhizobium sp. SG_E_25_P2]